jgi:hypothetical protein
LVDAKPVDDTTEQLYIERDAVQLGPRCSRLGRMNLKIIGVARG